MDNDPAWENCGVCAKGAELKWASRFKMICCWGVPHIEGHVFSEDEGRTSLTILELGI